MQNNQREIEAFARFLMRMRGCGIDDPNLISVIEKIPRRVFIPAHALELGWSDRTIPIGCGAFIEGIDTAVRMVHTLDVHKTHRVLEVGTGSGYLSAVLSRLCERVLSVDRYATLVTEAKDRLARLGYDNVIFRQADGMGGLAGEGTFDRIIVSGAFRTMPRDFIEQLGSAGIMLAPMLEEGSERPVLTHFTRVGNRFESKALFSVPYMVLQSGTASFL